MSSVPRSKVGVTPTATKFHPPAAPASARNPGRRGATPRSACKTQPRNAGAVAPKPKPKLSAEQQLDIIGRLESGNFKRGEGIQQFYDEIAALQAMPACRQNLFSSFALVDPLAASTRNYGNGLAGSLESLSMTSSGVSSVPSVDAEVSSAEVARGRVQNGVKGREYVLPDYIKVVDRFLSAKQCFHRSLLELAELRCKAEFAELLPQSKMETFLKSLGRTHKILQKFLNENASENMQLFLPSRPSKGPEPPTVHCDVEHQSQIIQSFHKLTDILERLNCFLMQNPKDFHLEAKLETLKDMVNKLEESLKDQEQQVSKVKELLKETSILNEDSASSAVGIEGLEDASL